MTRKNKPRFVCFGCGGPLPRKLAPCPACGRHVPDSLAKFARRKKRK